MDRFIRKVDRETGGKMMGDLEIVRIPMELYHARHATSRPWHRARAGDHPFARSPVFLAGLLAQRDLPARDLLDRYELYA